MMCGCRGQDSGAATIDDNIHTLLDDFHDVFQSALDAVVQRSRPQPRFDDLAGLETRGDPQKYFPQANEKKGI